MFVDARTLCRVRKTEIPLAPGQAYLTATCGLDATVKGVTLWNALTEQSRADFATGKTVSVDGWLLSQAERDCAVLMAVLPAA